MKAIATILCENATGMTSGIVGEHGFACYIETDHGNYLFDTGQGPGIIGNADILGKDLRRIEAIMISHGHYDHTGGLPAVLAKKGAVDVFAHPHIFRERYSTSGGTTRFTGIRQRRCYLESIGARFHLDTKMVEIGPGVYLTGEIPRNSAFEKESAHMIAYTETGEKCAPDPLKDDLSLVIEADRGLIVVLGCAHAGMVNIIDYVQQQFNRDRIFAVIGGTHLGFAGQARFDATLAAIDRLNIEKVGVSHCTGLPRAAALHARLKERFFFGCVGARIEG